MTTKFPHLPRLWIGFCTLIPSFFAHADEEKMVELLNMDLEALMDLEVKVASNKEKPLREQPGVVSVITAEDIQKTGARSLQDILKQVPGFWINTDTFSLFSASFRGISGMDAKILLIIDGIEQNEHAFGSIFFGNHYPADTIKQIEIIRGPGSVTYGGAAELAVIKVTTKGAELEGSHLITTADFTEHNIHNSNLIFMTGNTLENGLAYSFSASAGYGDYSNQDYTGITDHTVPLQDNSDMRPYNINLGLTYQTSELRIFYDQYRQEDRVVYGDLGIWLDDRDAPERAFTELTQPATVNFDMFDIHFTHRWQFNDQFTLTGLFSYNNQIPWERTVPERTYDGYVQTHRWTVGLRGFYEMDQQSNLLLGINYYDEKMEVFDPQVNKLDYFYFEDSQTKSVDDLAVYFQYENDFEWGNLTAGGRYEDHQAIGRKFVPRLALTKVWEQLHAKVMYSKAFKTPQFSTIASAILANNPIMDAEDTTDVEIEMGYQFSKTWQLTGNLYQLNIQDYIAFDSATLANVTAGDVTTYGGELLLTMRTGNLDLDLGYSNAQLSSTTVDTIRIEGEPRRVLGIPTHKLLVNTTYHFDQHSSINLNGVIVGSRYACFSDPANLICGGPHKLDLEYDFNLFYQREYQNWRLGIGIANLLNSEVWYVQPYRGSQPPTPGLERRLMLNLEYHF